MNRTGSPMTVGQLIETLAGFSAELPVCIAIDDLPFFEPLRSVALGGVGHENAVATWAPPSLPADMIRPEGSADLPFRTACIVLNAA